MAPLVLYHFPASPPSRSALLVLRNLELDVEVKIVNIFAGEQLAEEFLALNPEHTVPTLVDEDYVLWESKAIVTYLAEQYKPGSPMYPNDPKKRGVINQRLHYDSGTLFAATRNILLSVLRSGETVISQEKKDKLHQALEKMEAYLDGCDWVTGDDCTVTDLCMLSNIATVKQIGVSFEPFPNIAGWYERCQALPGVDENNEGAAMLANAVRSKLDEPY